MMEPIPVGGLSSLNIDEQIPFDEALVAADCYTDDNSIKPRNGYLNAITGKASVGAGTPQALVRYRASDSVARTIAVNNGQVLTVTDPSSETGVDGVSAAVSTPFGAVDKISAASLGKYLYLASSDATKPIQRMDSSFALTTLDAIAQGSKPVLQAYPTLAFSLFKNLAAPTITGVAVYGTSGIPGGATDWRSVTLTGANDDPASGITVRFNLGADQDWRNADWLAVTVAPRDEGGSSGSRRVVVQIARDVAGTPTDLTTIGSTYDVPAIAGGPSLLYCDLTQVPVAVRQAARYMTFLLDGASGGKFGLHGYLPLPTRPLSNPQTYYVDFVNPATLQQSDLTEGVEVTIKDTDKTLPTYQDLYCTSNNFAYSGGSADMLGGSNRRIFNREAFKAMPSDITQVGQTVTLRATLPSGVVATYIARLWKDSANGRRQVVTATLTGGDVAAGYIDLKDYGGTGTLTNTLYHPSGTAQGVSFLVSRGGRIVAGGVGAQCNRVRVSGFVAPGLTSDPFPQFPSLGVLTSDGWSFDVSPSTSEVLLAGVNGDALYIGTNQNTYALYDLTNRIDGSPPPFQPVLDRGPNGRLGMLYADKALFVAAYDGVYRVNNRADAVELSEPIRRFYASWFAPGTAVCMGYQSKKLLIFNGSNGRFLRYDFVKRRWSYGTLAHTVVATASWKDDGKEPQLWLYTSSGKIVRWQPTAASDDGTALPSWEYCTGYDVGGQNTRFSKLYLDTSGPVAVYFAKDSDNANSVRVDYSRGESAKGIPPSLVGYKWRMRVLGSGTTTVRRLMGEVVLIDKQGA